MKITHVVCQVLRLPKVTAKTDSSQDAVIIRIRTDDGLEGIGEVAAQPEVVKAVIDAPFSHNVACGLRELLVGENPLDTRRLWEKMYRRTMYIGRRAVVVATMGGVDMALWDLKGKYLKLPIHQLLGGKQHDRIKAYASILFGPDGAATADIGRRWVEAGYQAVKFGWEPMGRSEALPRSGPRRPSRRGRRGTADRRGVRLRSAHRAPPGPAVRRLRDRMAGGAARPG